jgi:LAGLIDADG endonuclease
MESIIKYLDCGQVLKRSSASAVDFKVGRFDDITAKVIPFLQKYPLQSVKQKDYQD